MLYWPEILNVNSSSPLSDELTVVVGSVPVPLVVPESLPDPDSLPEAEVPSVDSAGPRSSCVIVYGPLADTDTRL